MEKREIKFRAWDDDAKEMVLNDDVCKEMLMRQAIWDRWQPRSNNGIDYKGRIIWIQFTGLLDKNGKERCEGDIIRRITGYTFKEEKIWFLMGPKGAAQCYGYNYHPDDEIIGNIYEHSHLLNQGSTDERSVDK
jgi:hypothetical protein